VSKTSLEFAAAVVCVQVPGLVDLAMWINGCVLSIPRES
jgi:hypothetical protein